MAHIVPFNLTFDEPTFYNHNIFPNHMFRRLHARHHDPLGLHGLGLIGRWAAHAKLKHGGDMSVLAISSGDKMDKQLEIHLDVGLFQPEDLTLKIIDDYILVEGKHEEREDDHGVVCRHFKRRFPIPKGYDADKVESTVTTDGVLTVKVPKLLPLEDKTKEKIIPIQQVGASNLFVDSKTNPTNGN